MVAHCRLSSGRPSASSLRKCCAFLRTSQRANHASRKQKLFFCLLQQRHLSLRYFAVWPRPGRTCFMVTNEEEHWAQATVYLWKRSKEPGALRIRNNSGWVWSPKRSFRLGAPAGAGTSQECSAPHYPLGGKSYLVTRICKTNHQLVVCPVVL